MYGIKPPDVNALEQYRVNQPGQLEINYWPLYDIITYAQAGQTSLTFFQNPIGQGGKTIADTNMELAGQLPAPQKFMVLSVHIELYPPALVGRSGTAATGIATNANDVQEVMQSGSLEVSVGNKTYVEQAPLGMFPQSFGLSGLAALAGQGAVADVINITDYARVSGVPFNVIPFVIPTSQNFVARMTWPTTIGITADTRIGVRLGGFLYRSVQ